MWISERNKGQDSQGGGAQMGTVTIGGNPASVYWDGERRNLPVIGPKGYSWAPMAGDQVLVIKAGEEGENPCVVGVQMEEGVPPGSIRIVNGEGTAGIIIGTDGTISMIGRVLVNGEQVGPSPEEDDS